MIPRPKMTDEERKAKKSALRKKWGKENKEKFKQYLVEWRRKNPDKIKKYGRKYRQDHAEKIIEKDLRYKNRNAEKKKERNAKRYQENKETINKRNTEYRAKNKENAKNRNAELYKKNKDKIKRQHKEWVKANPDKVIALSKVHNHNRRARIISSKGRLSLGVEKKLLSIQKNRCAVCRTSLKKTGFHIDHIIPLARGGENVDSNVQVTCPKCNHEKSAKDPIQFMREKGFLL